MVILFEQISTLVGLPSGLLAALCAIESNHNPNAIRPNDGNGETSYGICQIKHSTASEVMPGVSRSELFNPEINATAAALYLKKKLDKYKKVDLALAAYNAGHVRYLEDGRLINLRYVRKVRREWRRQKLLVPISHIENL
jgi:soluble lytic murein transglycosylase-like protein